MNLWPVSPEPKSAAQLLREEYDQKLGDLQINCEHEEKEWMPHMWAPGHFTGKNVLVCKNCEKIVEDG